VNYQFSVVAVAFVRVPMVVEPVSQHETCGLVVGRFLDGREEGGAAAFCLRKWPGP
jgi:hypothetical protein